MFSIPGVGVLGVDGQKTKTDGGVGCWTVRDCMDMDASCRFNCSQLRRIRSKDKRKRTRYSGNGKLERHPEREPTPGFGRIAGSRGGMLSRQGICSAVIMTMMDDDDDGDDDDSSDDKCFARERARASRTLIMII